MIKNKRISLIIPCRNEARALEAVLGKLPKEIDEIIVVDNNSTDSTVKTARAFKARVFVEKRSKNGIGYGYALQKGLEQASGDILVCMDGDGSYPTREIIKIVNYLIKKNLDFISCNRLPFKDPKKMSSIRSFGVKILNLITLILFGYRIKDSLSGMWVFRKNVLKKISLAEGDWNFSLEIKLKSINFPGLSFIEYPISYHDRIFDKSKQNLFKTGITHALYLPMLKLAFLRHDLHVFFLKTKCDFLHNGSSLAKN